MILHIFLRQYSKTIEKTHKFVRFFSWLFVFGLFFSGVNNNDANKVFYLDGKYHLKASGNLNKELFGDIAFEIAHKKSVKGKMYSTLQLNLENSDDGVKHSMQFLISSVNKHKYINKGAYKVVNNIDGFINCFDGVFGFANVQVLGEEPFFANKGVITIYHLENEKVQGYIDVKMQNQNKHYFKIKGKFQAYKKENLKTANTN